MKDLPDKSVDLVVTSPPYNIRLNFRSKDGVYKPRSDSTRNKYLGYDDCMPMDKYYNFLKGVISESLRITRGYFFLNIQLLTGNKLALMQILGEYAGNIKEIIIWDKTSVEPSALDGVLNSEYEFIIVFAKHDVPIRQFQDFMFRRGELSNVWRIPKERNLFAKDHNAIMPESLAKRIVLHFCEQDGTVLDPFLGSGTTAIACIKTNRNFIGIEKEPKYVEIAEKRIKNELDQLKLAI